MNSNDVVFSILPYKAGYYWSKTLHKIIWMEDIAHIIWQEEDMPVSMEKMTFTDMVKYVSAHPGTDKKTRCAVMRFDTERFPLKDFIGLEHWNGIIFVDLDLQNSPLIEALSSEKHQELYSQLDYALQNICPDNYTYIEHSNSGIGIHVMFYFDCEKTQENYDKYSEYIFNIFRYEIDNYIKDFSHIFDQTICTHAVFDPVYRRPYQKLYLTTKDYKFYNVSGNCSDIVVEVDEQKEKSKEIERGQFDVKFITSKKKYDTEYYDRLYIITALKKYVGDIDKVREMWYKLCEQFTLYKNYTTREFKNMLDKKWNSIDASSGRIDVLKKYGFKIDERNLHIHLKEDEYISDVVNDIIKFSDNGINLLISGTGTGKTEVWKTLNDIYSQPLEISNHRPVLVVEPMNSIVKSKYDAAKFRIVIGSTQFGTLSGYEMIITNYNHLVKYTLDGNEVKEDIEKFFSQFELVIVDESHIMMKDTFRSDVLIPFMMSLNKIKDTKIIIQTATPLFERTTLHIKKTITIHKEEKCNTKVIYRQVEEKSFNISKIICLTNYYVTNGKKVYIYWKNGSLQNMNMLKSIFPEAMVIYHKRDNGSEDMKTINEFHKLDKTNVIISSVYFGVGNDLNDDVEDAAVIIIGNNIWQEDIQAKGRWRNAKNIEMCIILLPEDREQVEVSKNGSFDYGQRLESVKWRLTNIYEDAYNRDKSVIISGQAFTIKTKDYIDYLAKMQVANEYSSQFYIKNTEFRKLGYDVRENIKPLLTNADWEKELKAYRKNLKDIRNKQFCDILNGIYDWETIRKDTTIEQCAKIIRQLQRYDLLKYCDLDKFIKSKILRYKTFLKFYLNSKMDRNDFAELFSILWVKKNLKKVNDSIHKIYVDLELKYFDYIMVCGYFIWLYYRNKEDKAEYTKYNYYSQYIGVVDDMMNIEDELINRIFVKEAYSEEYNEFVKEFLVLTEGLNKKSVDKDNLFDEITKLNVDDEYNSKVIKMIVDYYKARQNKKKANSIGGQKGKEIEIDGVKYSTIKEAAEKLQVIPNTIHRWIKSGKAKYI